MASKYFLLVLSLSLLVSALPPIFTNMDMVSEVVPHNGTTLLSHAKVLRMFLQKSLLIHTETTLQTANVTLLKINDPTEQSALSDCIKLLDMSVDHIKGCVEILDKNAEHSYSDVHTWLSSVLTYLVTCQDELEKSPRMSMDLHLDNLISRARTSLAVFVSIPRPKNQWTNPMSGNFPSWIGDRDQKILQARGKSIKPDVVVAADGSGNYKTVNEAVASAPDNGNSRYIIYVKKGVYTEIVKIGKEKTNLMLTGDGMAETIITGSLNAADGIGTFRTATVAVDGMGFIAQDIGFQNTAGPQKGQAVALRVSGDVAAINRCLIDAFQDSLYAHSNKQFYRECYITGTVDFIFGNARIVIQNSQLVGRKPMAGQSVVVTAQGREQPGQNTAISIQNCSFIASSDLEPLKGSVKTYLGRPWKQFSRTVVMQSYIGDHIDPAGWSETNGNFALNTLYFGEYMNHGPGSDTSKRVNWPGFRVITDQAEAMKFTVAELIEGLSWLNTTGVPYTPGWV